MRQHLIAMRSLLTVCLFATGLALLSACDLTGTGCGPFDTPTVPVADFETQPLTATSDPFDTWPRLSPIESDTLTEGSFAIYMNALTSDRTALRLPSAPQAPAPASWTLIPTAHACTPPPIVATGTISSLRIYSSTPLFNGYSTEDNLAPLFDIAVRDVDGTGRVEPLETFLSGSADFAREIALVLTETPDTTAEAQFTVEFQQENGELETYSFTTDPVVIGTE